MNKHEQLRTTNAADAERLLTARLSGDAKSRLGQAFRLSAAALADEGDEWPAQIIARLRGDKDPDVKHILQWVAENREGCWLKPIWAPLIIAGGPIVEIIDVGAPYDHSRALVWSSERKTVTSFSGSSFRTWDLTAGREVRRLDLPIDWGRAAVANPPRRAVVMAAQRQLLLVSLNTGVAEAIFTGYVIESVAISADGAWAVSTSVPPDWDYGTHDWNGPRTLRLFDLRRRRCIRRWQAHRSVITDLALSADGRFLATVSRDQTALLFDLRKGGLVGSWRSARRLTAVAITPGAQRLAYASEGGVLTIRRQDGEMGRFTRCGAEPGCLALSKDGQRAVVANGGDVSVVDLRGSKRFGPFLGTQPYLTSLAIDAEARHAMTGEQGQQLVLWDLTRAGKAERSGSWISGIWASEDRALVHEDGLSLCDLSTGERTVLRPPGSYHVAAAPTAGIWAVTSWASASGGRIRIGKWGRKGTSLFFESGDLRRDMTTSIRISRNGARLVATVHPLGCRVLNLADRRTVWHQADLGPGVRPHLSPSGRYLLLCSLQGPMEIVDLDTQKVIQRNLPQSNIGSVLFLPEDDCVLVQQGENTALLNWRTNSLRTILPGSPSSISEDGHWMVTESNSRKLTLWMLQEECRMATFTLDAPVLHTALSPDGRFLIAGDQGGQVHVLQRQG